MKKKSDKFNFISSLLYVISLTALGLINLSCNKINNAESCAVKVVINGEISEYEFPLTSLEYPNFTSSDQLATVRLNGGVYHRSGKELNGAFGLYSVPTTTGKQLMGVTWVDFSSAQQYLLDDAFVDLKNRGLVVTDGSYELSDLFYAVGDKITLIHNNLGMTNQLPPVEVSFQIRAVRIN
jgi:hypothetical protein